jgi:hypothetical protein
MSKYGPLIDYLQSQGRSELHCSFREIEAALGFPLPPSARKHQAWWANDASRGGMTPVWMASGFRTEQVDIVKEQVVFRRVKTEGSQSPSGNVSPPDDAALIKSVLDVLCGEPEEAQQLRKAIIAALPGPKAKTAFDVFASDLSDKTFEGVFPEARDKDWRKVDL